jgi:hypothetical protein
LSLQSLPARLIRVPSVNPNKGQNVDVKEPRPFKVTGRFVIEVEHVVTARTPEEAESIFEMECGTTPQEVGMTVFCELNDTYAEELDE